MAEILHGVGGMPEAVEIFADTYPGADFNRIMQVQEDILQGYRGDFSKYADAMPRGFSLRLAQVWDSIPSQLARENKKFLYGAVRSGGRGKDFELAIQRLLDSSIALKVARVTAPEYPLKSFDDVDAFKLYTSDVGLLRTMNGASPESILDGDSVLVQRKALCRAIGMSGTCFVRIEPAIGRMPIRRTNLIFLRRTIGMLYRLK